MEIPSKVSGTDPEITVLLSDSHNGKFKNFRCVVCGKILFSYDNDRIRMILPSGYPAVEKPRKLIECTGTYALYTPSDLYNLLHSMLELSLATDDITKLRDALMLTAKEHEGERAIKCHARYFVT